MEPGRRDAWPVLRDENGILAVYGLAVGERACAQPGEPDAIKIEFIPWDGEE